MSFSGGVYTLPGPALVTGEVVSATENNQFRNDVAGAFNLTMLRNGTSTATANLPMGGYKLTGLGVATTSGDALSYGQAAVLAESVISVNSSSDALRITQTGAGNALVVEDSANPDSTPFVIDANGNAIVGLASSTTINSVSPVFEANANGASSISNAVINWSSAGSGAGGATQAFARSASGSRGSQGAVASGTVLSNVSSYGSDGSAFVEAARISAIVDGTPGTNDMPGRLVFSTTADGASTPTERMRIRSDGGIGIGDGGNSSQAFRIAKNITGGTTASAATVSSTIQSDVTSVGQSFNSFLNTSASSFTLASMYHFAAAQGTIGAGSTVTNQMGFYAGPSLTGATNNYGFYANNISVSTGKSSYGFYSTVNTGTGTNYNFYAAGTADNYFAGNTGFNKTDPSYIIDINVGSSTDRAVNIYNSDSTLSDGENIHSILFTQNDASYPNTTHAWIKTYAVGSTGDTAMAFATGGSGTATERMRIGTDGQVTLSANAGLTISKTAVTAPVATDGNVFSGTYTPTITNVTNVSASTANTTQYMRVGNVVTVSGRVDITATASATQTTIRMTLPIASAISSVQQLAGTGMAISGTSVAPVRITADAATDTASLVFVSFNTTSQVFSFQFTYLVI